jgi:hypothetical protein
MNDEGHRTSVVTVPLSFLDLAFVTKGQMRREPSRSAQNHEAR